MKPIHLAVLAMICAMVLLASTDNTMAAADDGDASPIYGVRIPAGYRQWQLIAPAEEAAPLNEIRAVLGNTIAVNAYRDGALPFPDGTVLAKLAWKHVPSPDFASASIPGAATTVQFMVKDSKKYAATGGWGFGRFVNGKAADEAQHRTCFACHQARAKAHDYVFTRYAH
ncbi:cytochrome P460 family protein [Dyella sp.]|uniref:cytochrome P460 family protein n=1 Tax=Dyella sp. TaxID=1869338 RepID=UPI002D76D01D|nr:cytochrome P460 family protein [Dyella sp.]HET7332179.1 cytochrome P460 family protein [Dyella sp.]